MPRRLFFFCKMRCQILPRMRRILCSDFASRGWRLLSPSNSTDPQVSGPHVWLPSLTKCFLLLHKYQTKTSHILSMPDFIGTDSPVLKLSRNRVICGGRIQVAQIFLVATFCTHRGYLVVSLFLIPLFQTMFENQNVLWMCCWEERFTNRSTKDFFV